MKIKQLLTGLATGAFLMSPIALTPVASACDPATGYDMQKQVQYNQCVRNGGNPYGGPNGPSAGGPNPPPPAQPPQQAPQGPGACGLDSCPDPPNQPTHGEGICAVTGACTVP
jgi:hypothetical protein